MKFSREQALEFYETMTVLRTVDDRIVPLKLKDLVMDGFHPYVGEEAVAVGVCSALKPEDYLISTHRPQGHALAKGASMRAIFAEILVIAQQSVHQICHLVDIPHPPHASLRNEHADVAVGFL